MSGFEVFGSLFGLWSIWLTVRASVWCWPIGIINIVLLLVTYAEARLYGDVVDYLVMLALSIWGWIAWVRRDPAGGARRVSWASPRTRGLAVAGALVGAALMGFVFDRFTDAALPYSDALVTALALVAQVLLACKLVDNWGFWIASDVLAVGVYASRGLYVLCGLYLVYLVFAIVGLRAWRAQA